MVSSVGDVFSPRLPSLIRVAQQRAQQLPEIHSVRHGPLVVSALLAFTSLAELQAPIRFSRQRLARVLGVTARTVDRRLADLERLGLAARVTPKGKVRGRWPVCHVRWSERAFQTFWPRGLPSSAPAAKPCPDAADGAPDSRSAPQTPRGSADRSRRLGHPPLLSHSSAREDLGSGESGRAGSAKDAQPTPHSFLRRLPGDLRPMAEVYGLRAEQVCTLMARCKQRGQRLQDVLAVAETSLRGRTGSSAMALLLHLVGLDRDYAAVRRRTQTREATTRAASRRTRREGGLLAAVRVGSVLGGLGVVVDRASDHVVVVREGHRAVADARTVARAVGVASGWRGLLAVRRGRGPVAALPSPGRASPTPGAPACTGLAGLVRALRAGVLHASAGKAEVQTARAQVSLHLGIRASAVAL